MQITSLKTDADLLNAAVPEGYLLVFMSKDSEGNLVKRYKNSSGEFGTLGCSAASDGDITDSVLSVILSAIAVNEEQAYILRLDANTISYELDTIIGEVVDPSELPLPVFRLILSEQKAVADTGQSISHHGNVTYTTVDGKTCAQFSGDGYIFAANVAGLPAGQSERTIIAKVKPSSSSSDKYVVSIGNSQDRCRYGFGFYDNSSIGVWCKNYTINYPFEYEDDQWYTVAVTLEDSIEKVYVNGVLIGTNERTDIDTGSDGVCIGAGIEDWVNKFSGYIADVSVYNIALYDVYIHALYLTERPIV